MISTKTIDNNRHNSQYNGRRRMISTEKWDLRSPKKLEEGSLIFERNFKRRKSTSIKILCEQQKKFKSMDLKEKEEESENRIAPN